MADNPRKKGRDRKTVSQQPHEQEYQRRKGRTNERSISRTSRDTSGERTGRSGTEGSENRGGESNR